MGEPIVDETLILLVPLDKQSPDRFGSFTRLPVPFQTQRLVNLTLKIL